MISLSMFEVVLFSFIVSWFGVFLYHRIAVALGIIDMPNERSSHVIPTPRGAGIVFVGVSLGAWLYLSLSGQLDAAYVIPLLISLSLAAAIGFCDDVFSLSPLFRFAVQSVAVVIPLAFFPALPIIQFGDWMIPWTGLVGIILFGTLVWFLNFFNFMDGIDGIAGGQAISVLVGACILLSVSGEYLFLIWPSVLIVAVAGFLIFNWPPARVFMGDAGSGFLGLAIGLIAVIAANETLLNVWCWLILMSLFIADATFTLVRRALAGKRFYEAHRSHAYQILSRRWQSHKKVSLLVIGVNVVVLLPLALVAMLWPYYGFLIFACVQVVLMYFAGRFRAGIDNI